ncbi:CHC2 zinc finger domain-containing protein [Desulfatibacillum aliphaticivorans]|uniref:CHC2 zinc finger domain-containing protein n=1 Tax=Desulfatibacillum aliphaticivorans TaxID=218208 RepID=UPI000423BDC0|nr:CHC2 zinc finger domain-containing protein [Desulfatibacillum aliphaticivorans]
MNILELLQSEGHELKKVANTQGGEYAGPCPFCWGEDRFRVWPEKNRYWCRGCDRKGDAIQFLRDRDGLSFFDACLALDMEPPRRQGGSRPLALRSVWIPKEPVEPGTLWQQKASGFLSRCQWTLWNNSGGAPGREFLQARGISESSARAAGLGWNHMDTWEAREAWGLEPEIKENGDLKKLWLPKGLVIPCLAHGKPLRIRIRRPDPGEGPRYYALQGSSFQPMTIGSGTVAVVVESDLDAILIAQEAPQNLFSLALGSVSDKPDRDAHEVLKQAGCILVALDADEAGTKAYLWWTGQYSQALWWTVPVGKDPGEAFQAGLSIGAWIRAGIDQAGKGPEPLKTSYPEHTKTCNSNFLRKDC